MSSRLFTSVCTTISWRLHYTSYPLLQTRHLFSTRGCMLPAWNCITLLCEYMHLHATHSHYIRKHICWRSVVFVYTVYPVSLVYPWTMSKLKWECGCVNLRLESSDNMHHSFWSINKLRNLTEFTVSRYGNHIWRPIQFRWLLCRAFISKRLNLESWPLLRMARPFVTCSSHASSNGFSLSLMRSAAWVLLSVYRVVSCGECAHYFSIKTCCGRTRSWSVHVRAVGAGFQFKPLFFQSICASAKYSYSGSCVCVFYSILIDIKRTFL